MKRVDPQPASPLTIRPFQAGDWPRIFEIHDAARPLELAGSCDPRAFVPIQEDPEIDHLRKCQVLVACRDERLVGFVGVDGDYLGWLYVDPLYHGQGIGRRLLRAGLELMPHKSWTITLAGNSRALALYQSEGFQEVRRYQSENAGYPCTCLRLERIS